MDSNKVRLLVEIYMDYLAGIVSDDSLELIKTEKECALKAVSSGSFREISRGVEITYWDNEGNKIRRFLPRGFIESAEDPMLSTILTPIYMEVRKKWLAENKEHALKLLEEGFDIVSIMEDKAKSLAMDMQLKSLKDKLIVVALSAMEYDFFDEKYLYHCGSSNEH